MSRSNWGTKSNQEYILGIDIKRNSWEELLSKRILTYPDKKLYNSGKEWEHAFKKSKVHIQWDPERSIRNTKLEIRTIQVGIGRELIEEYNSNWIAQITDFTPLTKKINSLRKAGKYKEAKKQLPKERVYDLPESIAKKIGIY